MSRLSVYPQNLPEQPNKVLCHADDIARTLAAVGVGFAQQPIPAAIAPRIGAADLNAACADLIEPLQAQGFAAVELLDTQTAEPPAALGERFAAEFYLACEHVSLILGGCCLVNLHLAEHVYALLCERGDCLTLPAGTRHWIDFGEPANACLIRLNKPAQDGALQYTGDAIAQQFPGLEEWR